MTPTYNNPILTEERFLELLNEWMNDPNGGQEFSEWLEWKQQESVIEVTNN